jgi:hypothetical protein
VEKGTAGLASVQAKVGQLGTGALGIGAAIGRELGLVSEDTTDAIWETYKALGEVQKEFSAVANDFDGSNKANKEAAEAAKRANQKQEGLADKLKALFTNIEKNKLIGPRQQDGIIEKFSQDVSAALADSGKQAKEAAKQNKLSGLDARSQAGLNFLLESGVAGKKPEAETAKNTRPLPSILTELKAIPKTLSVSIP